MQNDLFTSLLFTPDLGQVFLSCFRFPEVWEFRQVNKEMALYIPRLLHKVEWDSTIVFKSFSKATHLTLRGSFSSPIHITKGQFPRLRSLVLRAKAPSIEIDPRIHLQVLETYFDLCVNTSLNWEFLKEIYMLQSPEWLKKMFQQRPLEQLQWFGINSMDIRGYWPELLQLAPNLETVRCTNTEMVNCTVPKLSDVQVESFNSVLLLHPMVLESLDVDTKELECRHGAEFPYLHTFRFRTSKEESMVTWIQRLPTMPKLKDLQLQLSKDSSIVDLKHNPELQFCTFRHVDVVADSHPALKQLTCSGSTKTRLFNCPNLESLALSSTQEVLVLRALPSLKQLFVTPKVDWTSKDIFFDLDWTILERLSWPVFDNNSLHFSVFKTLLRLDQCTNLKRIDFQLHVEDDSTPIVTALLEKLRTMPRLQTCSFRNKDLNLYFENHVAIEKYLQKQRSFFRFFG